MLNKRILVCVGTTLLELLVTHTRSTTKKHDNCKYVIVEFYNCTVTHSQVQKAWADHCSLLFFSKLCLYVKD